MDNENTQVQESIVAEDSDSMMPSGWTESTDIFDASTWADSTPAADGQKEESIFGEGTTLETQLSAETPAIESETETAESETPDEYSGEPATLDTDVVTPKAISFSAVVDHEDVTVELDESELPELFQKAYATDRLRGKLDAQTPIVEKANLLATMLGYKDVEAMFDASEKDFTKREIEKLVKQNVPEILAKEMTERKLNELRDKHLKAAAEKAETIEKPKEEVSTSAPTKAGGRDFKPEVAELLATYPELKGKTLPQEVIQATVNGGKPLVLAYTDYANRQVKAENERLRKENNIYKQNAETAKRAPVSGVAKGGATTSSGTSLEDAFLSGFDKGFRY